MLNFSAMKLYWKCLDTVRWPYMRENEEEIPLFPWELDYIPYEEFFNAQIKEEKILIE